MNEKIQSTDANIEINQILEISEKDFKTTIIKVINYKLSETNGKK